jgi:hypothetical protein
VPLLRPRVAANHVASYNGHVYVGNRSVTDPSAAPKDWLLGRAAPVGAVAAWTRGRRLVFDNDRSFERHDIAVLVPDDEPLPWMASWWWVDRSLDDVLIQRVTYDLSATTGVIWMPRGADCAKLGTRTGMRPWHIVPRDVLQLAQWVPAKERE